MKPTNTNTTAGETSMNKDFFNIQNSNAKTSKNDIKQVLKKKAVQDRF